MARALWVVVAVIGAAFVAVSLLEIRSVVLVCSFAILWGATNLCFGIYRLLNAEWRQSAWWDQRKPLAFALGAGTTHFSRRGNRLLEYYSAGTQIVAGAGLIVLGSLPLT